MKTGRGGDSAAFSQQHLRSGGVLCIKHRAIGDSTVWIYAACFWGVLHQTWGFIHRWLQLIFCLRNWTSIDFLGHLLARPEAFKMLWGYYRYILVNQGPIMVQWTLEMASRLIRSCKFVFGHIMPQTSLVWWLMIMAYA